MCKLMPVITNQCKKVLNVIIAICERTLLYLVGTLAAAVPVAFLNPSLGFKKKRSAGNSSLSDFIEKLSKSVNSAISKHKVQDS